MGKNTTNTYKTLKLDHSIQPSTHQLPETGFLRIWHIIGNPKANPPIPALIPIGRTAFLNGIKSKKYKVTPIKLGVRTTAYRVEEIRQLIAELGGV